MRISSISFMVHHVILADGAATVILQSIAWNGATEETREFLKGRLSFILFDAMQFESIRSNKEVSYPGSLSSLVHGLAVIVAFNHASGFTVPLRSCVITLVSLAILRISAFLWNSRFA